MNFIYFRYYVPNVDALSITEVYKSFSEASAYGEFYISFCISQDIYKLHNISPLIVRKFKAEKLAPDNYFLYGKCCHIKEISPYRKNKMSAVEADKVTSVFVYAFGTGYADFSV